MDGLVIVAVGMIVVVCTSLFGPAVTRSRVRRKLRSGSSELAEGANVTLTGTVRETANLVESPLSARRGVFVHAMAVMPEADVDGPVTLKTQRMVPFELDTDAGVVLVDGTAADLEVKPKPLTPRDPERERSFIVSHRRGPEIVRIATFREFVLTPGMRITVHGIARLETNVNAERGYRDAVHMRARIVAGPDYPLAIGNATPKR